MVSGLILSLLDNVFFDFNNVEPASISTAVGTVLFSIILSFSFSVWASSKLFSSRKGIFGNFALHATLATERSFVGVDQDNVSLIGKTGIAQTVLRLSGKVSVEGTVYDAMSEGSFIEKGESIRIVRHEAGQLYVVRDIG